MDSIENKLKQIISEHLGVDAIKITDATHFADDLGTDSLDALDLLMAINEEFSIRIPAEQLANIHTVHDMLEAVRAAVK